MDVILTDLLDATLTGGLFVGGWGKADLSEGATVFAGEYVIPLPHVPSMVSIAHHSLDVTVSPQSTLILVQSLAYLHQ